MLLLLSGEGCAAGNGQIHKISVKVRQPFTKLAPVSVAGLFSVNSSPQKRSLDTIIVSGTAPN
jgi:hypothetical protein